MFRQHIQKMVDRMGGGVAGVLMDFDGITVQSYVREGPRRAKARPADHRDGGHAPRLSVAPFS